MAKWKCEICGNKFDNFHAQGFDNKIYCPLCFFKKENQELKKQLEDMTLCRNIASGHREEVQDRENILLNQQKEFIEWLEAMSIMYENGYKDIDSAEHYNCVLQKFKEIIGDGK